jgi:hypothetical protein
MIEPETTARLSRTGAALAFVEDVVPLAGIAFLIGCGLRYAEPEQTHPELAAGLALFGAVTGIARFLSRRWAHGGPSTDLARWISGGLLGGFTVAMSGLLEPRSFQVHAVPFGVALGTLFGLLLGLGEQRHMFTAGALAPRTSRQIRGIWALASGALVVVSGLLVLAYRTV